MDDNVVPMGPLKACPSCRALVRDATRKCPYCGDTLVGGGSFARWLRKFLQTQSLLSKTIVGVLAAIFVLEFILQASLFNRIEMGGSLLNLGGINGFMCILLGANGYPMVLEENEWWRLVTACFLHGSIMHILFNCMAMMNLGGLIEALWDRRKAWVAFVTTGIGGSVLSLIWHAMTRNDAPSVGASGAICGFLGMLLGLSFFNRKTLPDAAHKQVRTWVIYIAAFGLLIPGIDNAGHAGGLIAGVFFSFLFRPGRGEPGSLEDKAWTAAAYSCLLLVIVCIGFAADFYITDPHKMLKLIQ